MGVGPGQKKKKLSKLKMKIENDETRGKPSNWNARRLYTAVFVGWKERVYITSHHRLKITRDRLSLSLFFLLPFAFIKVGITLLVRRTRRRHRNRLSRLQYTFSTSSSLLACLYNQKRKEPRGCVCDASGRRLGTSTRHVHHIDPTTTTTTTTARREKGLYLERRRWRLKRIKERCWLRKLVKRK